MENLNIIIKNGNSFEDLAKDIKYWRISKGKLSSYFIFFNRVSYFSGYSSNFPKDARVKLDLPFDPAFNNLNNGLIVPFFADDPHEPASEAVVEKMKEGFNTVKGERWICHPGILKTDYAARHCFAPSINFEFLDGIVCPPDTIAIDDVLEFRHKRAPERQQFFDALYRTCESIDIDGKKLSVNIDKNKLNKSLEELNKTALERWKNNVRRSFEFGIKPNAITLASLAAAIAHYSGLGNLVEEIAAASLGAIAASVSLTPSIDNDDGFTKAMSFALNAKRNFDKPGTRLRR